MKVSNHQQVLLIHCCNRCNRFIDSLDIGFCLFGFRSDCFLITLVCVNFTQTLLSLHRHLVYSDTVERIPPALVETSINDSGYLVFDTDERLGLVFGMDDEGNLVVEYGGEE